MDGHGFPKSRVLRRKSLIAKVTGSTSEDCGGRAIGRGGERERDGPSAARVVGLDGVRCEHENPAGETEMEKRMNGSTPVAVRSPAGTVYACLPL